MKKHNLILVFVILFSTILSTSSYFVYTNDFTPNKDELVSEADIISSKKTYPTINKALPLDITTIYSGEDVYIDFVNTTKLYVKSTYQYNSINNLTHNISIRVTEPTANQVHMNVPDGWNFSSIIPSETMEYNITGNDYDFTPSQAPGSYLYNITFLSGTTYGRLTTRQNQYLTIDEFNDDLDVDGSFDVSFSGDFTRSNNLTNLSIQNEPVYSGNGSMCIIESSENDILFSQIGYEPPGVENNEEWIEVYNNGISPINLGDWTISDNSLTYTIALGTVLASQKNIVFAKSTAGFNALFGFNPDFGDLSLSLDNNGDELVLAHSNSTEIDYVSWEGFNATWNIFANSNNTITRNISISDTDTESDWLNDTTARPNVGGLDGDISTGITPNQNFDDGFYYISFVHLFETFTSGTVKLQWFDGESKEYVLNTSFPYWQPEFLLIHINGNTTWKNMLLNFTTSGEFVFYLDEFKIWKVNPLIIPTNIIHQYNVSSSLISWDLRQNFGVNNERVNYNITLTNTGANQNSTSVTTDSNGFSSYIYVNKTLDEAQLTVSTNSAYYFPYNTFNNLQESEVLRTDMNDGSTLVLNDLSGNNFDGTIDGADWTSDSVQGNGLDFERGNTDFVSFGNDSSFSFTDGDDIPFSISFWVNFESLVNFEILFSKYVTAGDHREYQCLVFGNGDMQLALFNPDGTTNIKQLATSLFTVNIWYFMVFTYSGNEINTGIKIYSNNTLLSTTPGLTGSYSGMTNRNGELIIGSDNDGTSNYFDGIIDEFRIYDKELSQSEINYLFQPDQQFQCQPRQIDKRPFNYETKLDGSLNEWDFKENTQDNYSLHSTFNDLESNEVLRTNMNTGSGATLFDQSSNGFDGTINDSTWISSPVQGNALDFERDEGSNFVDFGDEDEFSFTDGADDDLPMSFSFWLKLEDIVSGGTQGIISKDRQAPTRREWAILTAGGKLEIEIFDQSTGGFIARTTSSLLTANVLYHFVITYSGSNTMDGIKFWQNGTEPSTTNRTIGAYTGMENTAAELTFANSFSANYLDGILDDVRIYDKELSQSEIDFIYESQTLDQFDRTTTNNGYIDIDFPVNSGIRTNSTIDADIYDSLELRVISNVSVGLQIQNYDSSTNFSTVQSVTTSYQILPITLTDWSGTQSSLRIQISGSNYQVRIDYIRLIRPITTVITSNDPFWIINSLDDSFSYVFNITYAGDIIRSGTMVDNVRQVSKQNGNTVINVIAIQDTSYPNECLLPCDLVTKTITTKGVEMVDEPQYWVNIISMLILLIVIFIGIAMFKLYWRTVK